MFYSRLFLLGTVPFLLGFFIFSRKSVSFAFASFELSLLEDSKAYAFSSKLLLLLLALDSFFSALLIFLGWGSSSPSLFRPLAFLLTVDGLPLLTLLLTLAAYKTPLVFLLWLTALILLRFFNVALDGVVAVALISRNSGCTKLY